MSCIHTVINTGGTLISMELQIHCLCFVFYLKVLHLLHGAVSNDKCCIETSSIKLSNNYFHLLVFLAIQFLIIKKMFLMRNKKFSSILLEYIQLNPCHAMKCVGWDSVVGIVTYYKLDCLGIESWLARGFLQLSRPALCPTQYNGYLISFLG